LLKRIIEKIDRTCLLPQKNIRQRFHPCESAARGRVFIAGMQRSGTNMLMNVLEQSFETDVYHEQDPRAFVDYQLRDTGVIHGLIQRSRARKFVIKALCELQELAILMETFSPAKTIWIVRDYNDVVNSMLRSFRNMSKQVQRIALDRNSNGWLGRGMSDETHERVRSLVTDSLDDNSASALQWYFRNMLFFDQNFDKDDRVLLVGYERLVSFPSQEFKRIFEFLEIEYSPRVSRNVTPRAIGKNPPPEIAPSIRLLCDGLLGRFHSLTGDGA
jgi:hypothetical protein